MTPMKVLVLVLFLLATASLQAQDEPKVFFGQYATDLERSCKNIGVWEPGGQGDRAEARSCLSYIEGLVDGGSWAANSNNDFPVCIPEHVTGGQLAKVVGKYGDDHPENLHWPAVRFVIEALKGAFPCAAR